MPGEESVKRFERSNGLDTALYKTIPLPLSDNTVFISCFALSLTLGYYHFKCAISLLIFIPRFSAVTFRQFVANLLSTLSTMTELTHIRIRQDLLDLTRRYDDCMRTCEIPFTKRSQRKKSTLYLLRRLYSRLDLGMCVASVF